MTRRMILGLALAALLVANASGQYPGWEHAGSLYVLTTPEGADLPATALEHDFPLLVRLHKGVFDFGQAQPNGEDIRFSAEGKALVYQVEEWDAKEGTASIWVRIPVITGNARQEIKVHWGQADAVSESKGSAVFHANKGYATVLHLDEALMDEADTITAKDAGSTATRGIAGQGRHFVPGKGVDAGNDITAYPFGDNPLTSEAWFRAEAAGSAIFGWGRYATRFNGKTGDGNEVVIYTGLPTRV